MEVLSYLGTALIAYLIGSIPTGYLVARAKGIDIRKSGSGNIGATNAFRVLGKPAGIFVLLADAAKGYLACKLITFHGSSLNPEYQSIVAGLCVILGHNYTCWLRFKGGKGIATSAGVLLAWAPPALGIALGLWLITFAISRYVSLASIAAAAILPFAAWLTGGSRSLVLIMLFVGGLAVFKHKPNIERLLNGTENRFGSKA